MCLIVDANVAAQVFAENPAPDFKPIVDWLFSPRHQARLAIGGHLSQELEQNGRVRAAVRSLIQAGRVKTETVAAIQIEERALVASGLCRSDDPHILGLARRTGARLICTNDDDLQRDFRDAKILGGTRGRIYKRAEHRQLLFRNDVCPK